MYKEVTRNDDRLIDHDQWLYIYIMTSCKPLIVNSQQACTAANDELISLVNFHYNQLSNGHFNVPYFIALSLETTAFCSKVSQHFH